MSQAIADVKFAQRYLAAITTTKDGLTRVAAHVNRARSSYWKGIKQPFLLSEDAAKRLTEVERQIDRLFVALDAANVALAADAKHHEAKIKTAMPLAQADIAKQPSKEAILQRAGKYNLSLTDAADQLWQIAKEDAEEK